VYIVYSVIHIDKTRDVVNHKFDSTNNSVVSSLDAEPLSCEEDRVLLIVVFLHHPWIYLRIDGNVEQSLVPLVVSPHNSNERPKQKIMHKNNFKCNM